MRNLRYCVPHTLTGRYVPTRIVVNFDIERCKLYVLAVSYAISLVQDLIEATYISYYTIRFRTIG